MELRLLEYFLAIAKEKSITKAAHSLHLTQPTLSRQLKELEDELGKQLVIRGPRSITLTEEGKILNKRAQEIIALVKKAEQEITNNGVKITGSVQIGAGETKIVHLLTETAAQLNKKYPDIQLNITSGDLNDIQEDLNNGLLDFALIFGPVDNTAYYSIKCPFRDYWGVLMRKDSPLSDKENITPKDLKNQPLIISRQSSSYGKIQNWFGHNIKMKIVATYNLIFNASLMVTDGLGYAIILDILDLPKDSPLCFRRLSPPLFSEPQIIWKKDQVFSKAAELFLRELKKTIKSYNPD